MGRIALIGSNGQLGTDLLKAWPASPIRGSDEFVGLVRSDLELRDVEQVRSVPGGMSPTVVINTAAFHRVDDCEGEPEAAFSIHAIGLKNLAETCRELGSLLVHFSTDYVFDGASGSPYRESDLASPISSYGISSAAGEFFVRYILPQDHVIIRSSGLFGTAGASDKGGNFIETMLRLASSDQAIRVVTDQVLAPTYTHDLAARVFEVLARGGRGTFHVTNSGRCSWYEFANEIFRQAGLQPDLSGISSAEFCAVAARPAFSVLESERLDELSLRPLRPWQEALSDHLAAKKPAA